MLSNTKIIQEVLKENSILFKHMISDIKFDAKYSNLKKYKTIVIIGMGGSILRNKGYLLILKT